MKNKLTEQELKENFKEIDFEAELETFC